MITGYIAVAWNPTNSVPKGYLYWEAGVKAVSPVLGLRGARAGVASGKARYQAGTGYPEPLDVKLAAEYRGWASGSTEEAGGIWAVRGRRQ